MISRANLTATELFGLDRKNLIKKRFSQFIKQEDQDLFYLLRKKILETETRQSLELRIVNSNGDEIWVDLRGDLLHSDLDKTQLNIILTDITERKEIEMQHRLSEERFQQLFDNMFNGVALYQPINDGEDFIILDLNKEGEKLSNIKREDIIEKKVTEIFPSIKDIGLFKVFQEVNITGKPKHFPLTRYEDKRITQWVENHIYKLPGGQIVAIYKDSSAEKLAQDELRESENKYKTLFENALVAQFRVSIDNGKVVAANKVAADLFGYKSAQHFIKEFKPENHHANLEERALLLKELNDKKFINRIMMHSKKLDGSLIWNESSFRIDPSGKFLDCFSIDSTKEVLFKNSLKLSSNNLRKLTKHLNKIREEERKEISREIHDDIGQALTALKLDLSWIQKKGKIDDQEIIAKIDEMKTTVDQTTTSIQKISMELRPGLLDDLGLAYAIKWQCEQFSSRSEIECIVKISPEELIVAEFVGVELFRILQEALTNIARHSKASLVKVSLMKEGNILELNIADNGIGIDEKEIEDNNSLGLLGIHERVRSINGSIVINGKKNIGTEISVKVKLYRGE